MERITQIDKLSLLLSGQVYVSCKGHVLHTISRHKFLDSPEWFRINSDGTYQVSIIAVQESRILIWDLDKLKLLILKEPYLQSILDNILSKDVVKKLIIITDNYTNFISNIRNDNVSP